MRVTISAVLALAAVGCRRDREPPPPPAVDLARLPRTAACTSDCDRVLLDELRAAVRGRPPLRLFQHQVIAKPEEAAAAIRRDGWVVRGRPFRVDLPIDWGADPFGDRNWRFQLNAMYFAVPFLQIHDKSGDADAFGFAKGIMLDWIDFNLVKQRANDFRWYDHATGIRAALLAYILDRSLRRDDLSAGELDRLLSAARQHLAHLSSREELASNNHALFQLAGLAGLCAALPELAGCDAGRAYASQQFARIVRQQFTSDGIHSENSPFYHAYGLQAIEQVTETGWLALSSESSTRLAQAWANLPWLVRPDGAFAAIGDSHGRPTVVQRRRLAALSPDATTHRAFATGGYAIVRAPSSGGSGSPGYLFLTAAFHSRAHKHRDALSFEWFDRGLPILVDSGVYSTNRDARRDYVLSTRAHNTVEVDGGDIDGGPPRAPALLATAQTGETWVIAAEVAHPELATRHRRFLVYAPGAWLLVRDQLTADKPRAFTAWFHLNPKATATAGAGAGRIELPGVREPLRMFDLTGRATVTAVRGAEEPRLQGWVTGSYGSLVPNDAIGLTQTGRAATFDTLFLFADDSAAPPAAIAPAPSAGGATDLCWRQGSAVHGVRAEVQGGTLKLAGCGR